MLSAHTESNFEINFPRRIGHISITSVVGSGSTCVLCLGKDIQNPNLGKVAIKIISMSDPNFDHEKVKSEIRILNIIKNNPHPNLIKIHEIFEARVDGNDLIFIVMEHCSNGDLFDAIVESRVRETSTKKKILNGIIKGIIHLHKQCGISHCDIKPENVVLNEKFEPKLIDFGSATEFEIGYEDDKAGTLMYAAPELLCDEVKIFNTRKIDIYSLGILMCTLFTGEFPYSNKNNGNQKKFIKSIVNGKLVFPKSMNESLKEIAIKCTNLHPEKRPSIDAIDTDEWLNSTKSNNKRL